MSKMIPNQAVNFDKRCIHIAIPKTGSNTVRSQLRPKGEPLIANPHLDILQVRDAICFYFLKKSSANNNSYPTKESLPNYADVRKQAATTFDSFFKFGPVRNPWARAVSLYHRREGIPMSGQMTFEEFCENHLYASDTCVYPTLHRNQLDWFCDEHGNFIMDYVFKIEEFETAIKEIEERTERRIKLEYRKANANPASRAQDYRKAYTSRTKNLIGDQFKTDIEYFGYEF